MFGILSREFRVSINELLAGEYLTDEKFRQKADENIVAVTKANIFSFEEKKAYFKNKWRREHISLFVVLFLIVLAVTVLPILFDKAYLAGFAPLAAWIAYGYQNNQMMIYVEHNLYKSNVL